MVSSSNKRKLPASNQDLKKAPLKSLISLIDTTFSALNPIIGYITPNPSSTSFGDNKVLALTNLINSSWKELSIIAKDQSSHQ